MYCVLGSSSCRIAFGAACSGCTSSLFAEALQPSTRPSLLSWIHFCNASHDTSTTHAQTSRFLSSGEGKQEQKAKITVVFSLKPSALLYWQWFGLLEGSLHLRYNALLELWGSPGAGFFHVENHSAEKRKSRLRVPPRVFCVVAYWWVEWKRSAVCDE